MKKYFFRFRKIIMLLLMAFCLLLSYSFDELNDTDVRALSLGQVKAMGGFFSNPSALSLSDKIEVGGSYYNRFNMKELSTYACYITIPNRFLDAGFQLSHFGFEDYYSILAQSVLAKKISSGLTIGTSLNYINVNSFLETEIRSIFSADIGFSGSIGDNIEYGFLVENLLRTDYAAQTVCLAGVAFPLLENFSLLLEGGCDFRGNYRFSTGIEYIIEEQFIIRGGYNSNNDMPTFGFAYDCERWRIEIASMFHPVLGILSAIGICTYF
ncbi:MAG: hypothetical protein LBJ17_02245 [Dysgonamonadaceae bacterium]|jgi:hypothetical protein|nr:hypothetical protein [Dysgonamonadaceae bacterium]